MNEQLTRIAQRLETCQRVLFITGAGMSADSGLPTYRGVGGLYARGTTEEGIAIEEALSGSMMQRDPGLCWKYIMQVESASRGAKPNAGHCAIVTMAERFESLVVLTQNVDGLHREAGSQVVIDIHGDVRQLLCTQCGQRQTVANYAGLSCPPQCASCSGLVRPDVVLFGEVLPAEKVAALQAEVERGFDAVFSIGTTSVFPYIAAPVYAGRRRGALTVEVNPAVTGVSDVVDEKIDAGASETLAALLDCLN